MTCNGPGCGVEWTCDMQHGIVDGRCTLCHLMAQAASNLNLEQVTAVLRTVERPARPATGAAFIDRRCSHGTCDKKRHYVVEGRCTNCEWTGYVWITLGHTVVDRCSQAECPRCKCRTIRGGAYVEA